MTRPSPVARMYAARTRLDHATDLLRRTPVTSPYWDDRLADVERALALLADRANDRRGAL